MMVVGRSETSVRLGVERLQGTNYDVHVGYTTRMTTMADNFADIAIYPALADEDYAQKNGTLNFPPFSQALEYIELDLTPVTASRNPYPKQFYIQLHTPTNLASISRAYNRSVIMIVPDNEVDVWDIVVRQHQQLFNNTNLIR